MQQTGLDFILCFFVFFFAFLGLRRRLLALFFRRREKVSEIQNPLTQFDFRAFIFATKKRFIGKGQCEWTSAPAQLEISQLRMEWIDGEKISGFTQQIYWYAINYSTYIQRFMFPTDLRPTIALIIISWLPSCHIVCGAELMLFVSFWVFQTFNWMWVCVCSIRSIARSAQKWMVRTPHTKS